MLMLRCILKLKPSQARANTERSCREESPKIVHQQNGPGDGFARIPRVVYIDLFIYYILRSHRTGKVQVHPRTPFSSFMLRIRNWSSIIYRGNTQ